MNNLEKNLRENIGKKIKLARKNAEYTQEALAEKLSLSPRYISQLERGIAFGSATTIINLCKVLNISSDFLFADLIKNTLPVNKISFYSEIISKYSKLNDYNIKKGRGNVENKDVFLVTENTNNVYYLKGFKYRGKVYFNN